MKKVFIIILGAWLVLSTSAVLFLNFDDVVGRGRILMGWGLIILWVVIGGWIMIKNRDRIRGFVLNINIGWKKKFVIFCTLLALIEEAIATLMTNFAPAFGIPWGTNGITASTNFFDVIFFHSVIVFFPMFLAWAWLLKRYDFSPFTVFLLFGVTGTLAEGKIPEIGLWLFVYGLMVYLPVYCIPSDRGARSPRFYHYPLAVVLPIISVALTGWIPVVFKHPTLHFKV